MVSCTHRVVIGPSGCRIENGSEKCFNCIVRLVAVGNTSFLDLHGCEGQSIGV